MRDTNNVIKEEFLLLAERLKLDAQAVPLDIVGTPGYAPPTFTDKKVGQGTVRLCIGPYMANWKQVETKTRRLSANELESLINVYKKLFSPRRQIRFIGVDLDDCLYDVTPIRRLIVQKISNEVGARCNVPLQSELCWALYYEYKDVLEPENVRKQKASSILISSGFSHNTDEIVEVSYNAYKDFSRLDTPEVRVLYKPYEGVTETLGQLMGRGEFVVGILTNGPSKFQKDKLNLLGLREGEHFNFVAVSEEIGIGKTIRGFFESARDMASRYTRNPLNDGDCCILDDQVKNLAGADGWLKVQYLRGYHSSIMPANTHEIPKYGITRFSDIQILLDLERDSSFQAASGSYFILKSLLLLRQIPQLLEKR